MKKKALPKCPNCKKTYQVKEVDDKDTYPLVISHESNTCPFGLISYQHSKKECIESVNNYNKEIFSRG